MMAEACDSSPEALREVLGGEELAWLRDRVRRRLLHGRGVDGVVTRERPTPAEVAAVARLLGRRLRATRSLRVSLPEVSAALARARLATDVAEAVQRLDGRVVDQRAARDARERAWQLALAPLGDATARRPELGAWVESGAAARLVRRLAVDPDEGGRLVRRTLRVLDALPAGGVRLATLAAERAGDAHALDVDTALSTLVLAAVRAMFGDPLLEGAEGRRESWAAAGVLVDDLTTQVLVLNLPAGGDGLCDRLLTAGAAHGEPVALTLGQLTRHPPDLAPAAGLVVSICENVTVLAEAAARLGATAGPLVCARGQPTVAVMRLLVRLAVAGARMRYHGDFDWPGVAIANRVLRATNAAPWRFGADDYLAADHLGAARLKGGPVDAAWDARLRPAMAQAGVAVEEERVLDVLLADVAGGG